MSAQTVDVLHAIDQANTALGVAGLAENDIFRAELSAARAAVAELIERQAAAQTVFDCILRGINDGNVSTYGSGWLESWAKKMIASGFRATNPDASDIRAALARLGVQS